MIDAMMYLLSSSVNTEQLLNFFVVNSSGFLTDAYLVELKITTIGGSQIHPIAGGWLDVTTIGRFDTGSYYAVEVDGSEGWNVIVGGAGPHVINWRYKLTASDDYVTWSMKFYVDTSPGIYGYPYRTIISLSEVRDEGLTVSEVSNAKLESLIGLVNDYIEEATQQVFRPTPRTFRVDGPHHERLFLANPIIGIDYVKPDRSTEALEETALAINFTRVDLTYKDRLKPDPRRNPSIALTPARFYLEASRYYRHNPMFGVGRLNHEIKGVFGFLESDGSVPKLIEQAALELVFANVVTLEPGATTTTAGPLIEETTDRHSVRYGSTTASEGSSALATSRRIEEILKAYRSPIGLGAPGPSLAIGRLSI